MPHRSSPQNLIAGFGLALMLLAGAASPVQATAPQAQGPARAQTDPLAPDQVFTFPGGPDGAVEAGVWLPASGCRRVPPMAGPRP